MREYGEENFTVEVLQQGYEDNYQYINERQQYWIQKKQSYCGTGLGYNMDKGGSNKNHSKKLTDQEIQEVKRILKQEQDTFLDIQQKFNISAPFLSAINHGTYFFNDKEQYPLRKYYKEDNDYDELIDLLLHSSLSLKQISQQLEMGYSTVKKINAGTLRKGLYPTYPIRTKTANEQRADKIKDLLLNTDFSKTEISKMTKASMETVRRVNIGEVFYDNKLSYPLRSL